MCIHFCLFFPFLFIVFFRLTYYRSNLLSVKHQCKCRPSNRQTALNFSLCASVCVCVCVCVCSLNVNFNVHECPWTPRQKRDRTCNVHIPPPLTSFPSPYFISPTLSIFFAKLNEQVVVNMESDFTLQVDIAYWHHFYNPLALLLACLMREKDTCACTHTYTHIASHIVYSNRHMTEANLFVLYLSK